LFNPIPDRTQEQLLGLSMPEYGMLPRVASPGSGTSQRDTIELDTAHPDDGCRAAAAPNSLDSSPARRVWGAP
jgi:hypothetical protein